MIAQRFRPVAWVAGVATAATMLYMISAQVAAERGRLEAIDQQIADTRDQIRQLQTEMGSRASLRQLERWNGEVLALSAPSARQYVDGEDGISAISSSNLGAEGVAPPPVMAAVLAKPATPLVSNEAPPQPLTSQDQLVQRAVAAADTPSPPIAAPKPVASPKPKPASVTRVASANPATGKERKLADIIKSVKTEVRAAGGKE
jgi:cell division septation protein DedD